MTRFRVDITSGPQFGDAQTVELIRRAAADLANLAVQRVGEGAVGVEFDVEANGLADALEEGEQELGQRLRGAGIEMKFFRGGVTAWSE